MTNIYTSNFSLENSNLNSSSENVQKSLVPFQLSRKSNQTNVQTSKNGNRSTSQKGGEQTFLKGSASSKRKVFSVSQIVARVHQKKQRKFDQKKRKKPLKPIIPPKSFLLLFIRKLALHYTKYLCNIFSDEMIFCVFHFSFLKRKGFFEDCFKSFWLSVKSCFYAAAEMLRQFYMKSTFAWQF